MSKFTIEEQASAQRAIVANTQRITKLQGELNVAVNDSQFSQELNELIIKYTNPMWAAHDKIAKM